ncbi:PASTA domain-containing protein [Streptomyces sp. NPDC051172]|uniref:Stk1 family PASTA domain-containing Ser/Thr kinase n=1 Tax=Streptomyces sp. NPDC051172 TaxID=3155796 RepID=UPI00341499EF
MDALGARTVLDRAFDGGDEEEPDGDVPAESGRRRGRAALIGMGVAVVVAALVLGWFMFGRGTADDGKADVPDLVGQSLEEARRTADNVGLTLTVTKKEPCADQPKGHICEQTPLDGRLDKGEAVSVTVSSGAPKVEVPDVTDKNEDDASRILEDKGFEVKLRHKVSTKDAGTVLEQDPAGGDSVEKGTEITLTVTKKAEKATVPDLTGSTLSVARKLLAEHDLELGDTTEVDSSEAAGTVVEQSAAAGHEVEPGSSVDVQIAKSVQTVQIPTDIVGKTLAEVQNELGGLGLQATVASGYSQASDAVVTSSTPAAGSEVEAGSTVVVVTEEAQDPSSDDGTPAEDTATTPGATNGGQ